MLDAAREGTLLPTEGSDDDDISLPGVPNRTVVHSEGFKLEPTSAKHASPATVEAKEKNFADQLFQKSFKNMQLNFADQGE